jgi:hypothetical protein
MKISTDMRSLLDLASPPISSEVSKFVPRPEFGQVGEELQALLYERNGFYAFESALLIRPSCSPGVSLEVSLEEWNEPTLWTKEYGDLADHYLFFGEDLFGIQFCIGKGGILAFDPETGAKSLVAADLSGWARQILIDYKFLTGYPLAHEWQQRHGPLPPRKRLVPNIPFVMGGQFDLTNLYLADSLNAMWARANIARQIRGIPDGASVKLVVED